MGHDPWGIIYEGIPRQVNQAWLQRQIRMQNESRRNVGRFFSSWLDKIIRGLNPIKGAGPPACPGDPTM